MRSITTATDNHIYHNNLGFAARGIHTHLTARGNLLEANKFGIYMAFGGLDLGTEDEAGGNTFSNNRHGALYAKVVTTDTAAIGNQWEPDEHGADAEGHYPPGTTFTAGPDTCPNTTLDAIDTAFDASCEFGFEKTEGYQNIVIDDGACEGGEATEVGVFVVSALDTED